MQREQKSRGFTLLEMLVVVGIIAVLLGIAIPSLAKVQKDLRMKELDDTARQVFLVAQDRLTTMKATGELVKFQNKMDTDMAGQKLSGPLDRPQDFGESGDEWKRLFYLNSDQNITKEFLLGSDTALMGTLPSGYFMIELNPYSGDVYSVFYVEDRTITRDQITALIDRTRKSRQKTSLGYYGGNAELSASAEIPTKFEPRVTLVNAEDLYFALECSGLRRLIATQDKLTITITVTDESYDELRPEGGHIWSKQLTSADFRINALGELETALTLDSMRTGGSFWQTTGGNLTPGDDIKITAVMKYVNDDLSIEGQAKAEGNSLFGKRSKSETVTDGMEIQVGQVRHLNNLRYAIYEHTATGPLAIIQTSEVNFDQEKWKENALTPGSAKPNLLYFAAIENPSIFTSLAGRISYQGNGNQLRDFVFGSSGAETVGLFAKLNGCTVSGVRLADSKVEGNYSKVGLLAAETVDCTITDSRAFLNTKDSEGRFAIDEAYVEAHTMKLGTGTLAGALIGNAVNTAIDTSFGAVPINGGSQLGGLVGYMQGGSIKNSYGSGDITANGVAGGLVGTMQGGTVENSYSSGDILTPNHGGGMAGDTMGGVIFSNCTSYGEVKVAAGIWDNVTSGPFVGVQTDANTYTECRYFSQTGYNSGYSGASKDYGMATSYITLCSPTPNGLDSSFPYLQELSGLAFPFPLLKAGEVTLPHYGNWPAELRLQTSLVYYEKYKDGEYGYYAVTSLTTSGDDTTTDPDEEEGLNKWQVDTLRPETCIEDGYALMTIYALEKYNCSLEGGADKEITVVDDPAAVGYDKSAKIASNITLNFTNGDLVFRISNANVYQLPFDYQVVNRTTPSSFYTKLVVNANVDGKNVINNFTFYYCPDFAKNAVNPNPDTSETVYPVNPAGEANPVYVRSAKQLNGLGRSYYYWNMSNSATKEKFYFKQETDINFATYTQNYCGKSYRLMDTSESNIYRNKPIGRPGNQAGASFQNIYDGGGFQIIDYCMETYPSDFVEYGFRRGFQYAGMFGEIRFATLKNIVMVASEPGSDDENSSGYIKSRYVPGSNPGVGALVGLVYVAGSSDREEDKAQILNCTVSGYDVSYSVQREPDSAYGGRGYGVVGGMIGFNYGTVKNCTATMKKVEFLQTGGSDARLTRSIGGLVGSMNDKGTVTNCYAAGKLVGSAGIGKVIYGGIAGGHQTQSGERNLTRKIENSYSACEWDSTVQVNPSGYSSICPDGAMVTMTNCFYLTDAVKEGITFTTVAGVTGKNAEELSAMSMAGFGRADASNTYAWPGAPKIGYPFPAIIQDASDNYYHYGNWYGMSKQRPSALMVYYEEYQMQATGNIEWRCSYLRPTGVVSSNLLKNKGKILTSGYGLLVADPARPLPEIIGIDGLDYAGTPAGAERISTSYGLYALRPFTESSMSMLDPGAGSYGDKLVLNYENIDLYSGAAEAAQTEFYMNVKFAEALSAITNLGSPENPLRIRTLGQLQKMTKNEAPQGGYFAIGESIWAAGLTNSLVSDKFSLDGGYVAGGDRISLDGHTGEIGSNGCYIFGLTKPLFETISSGSTIENLALLDVNILGTYNMASLAVSNEGKILQCLARGSVECTTDKMVGGFVHTNSGRIEKSYFNGVVKAPTATSDSVAGAFAASNVGIIDQCYAGGTVTAAQTAGFAYKNHGGTITNSYTMADVTGGAMAKYGFTSQDFVVTNCFWAQDPAWNGSSTIINRDEATANDLKKMTRISLGTDWLTKDASKASFPDSEACKGKGYSYPRLKVLDYYGDWPLTTASSTGAPFAGYGYYNSAYSYNVWVADDGLNITNHTANTPSFSPGLSFPLAIFPDTVNPSKYTCRIESFGEVNDVILAEKYLVPSIAGLKPYEIKLASGGWIYWKVEFFYIKDNDTGVEYKFMFDGSNVTVTEITE